MTSAIEIIASLVAIAVAILYFSRFQNSRETNRG